MTSAHGETLGTAQGALRHRTGRHPRGCPARGARREGVKADHSDATALLNAGVLDRAEFGVIVFPFEAVKVEFLLEAV